MLKMAFQLENEFFVASIVEVSVNNIAFWISVGVDDWTAEWAIIATNAQSSKYVVIGLCIQVFFVMRAVNLRTERALFYFSFQMIWYRMANQISTHCLPTANQKLWKRMML